MSKFRKRPVVIEAVQWTGENLGEIHEFVGDVALSPDEDNRIGIETPEGCMLASAGDWIIRGVKGEIYPCKPDIFEQTYEVAD